MDIIALITELTARVDSLESRVEEQDAVIEQLRYEGAARTVTAEDDYDYYVEGEWDAL